MSSEEEFSLVSQEDSPQGAGSVGDFVFDQEMLPLVNTVQQMDLYGEDSAAAHLEDKQLETARLDSLLQEEKELLRKIQTAKNALGEEDRLQQRLHQQAEVLSRAPERPVNLRSVAAQTGGAARFDTRSRVVYPMDGGTALITFEEEAVARRVLELKQHTVSLGHEYRTTLEARPVQLVAPAQVEVDSSICPRQVRVSDLPPMEAERLEDKLGFHFSKKANGGGEVQSCRVTDGGTAVVTFAEEGVADALVLQQFSDLQVQSGARRVSVMPHVRGQMSRIETRTLVCSRTVLLTGILDLLDRATLQDHLVAHFQRPSNGGGEVLECLYNPPGHHTMALFTDQRVA